MMQDITLFYTAGKGRSNNDSNNRLREDVLLLLYSPPEHFVIDNEYGNQWQNMSFKWREFVKTLCDKEFDNVSIKKVANRKRFDLEINYMKDNQLVHKVQGEFKHNIKSISKLPQYYSASENKGYIPVNYASYFYDNYLDKICELCSLEKIDKESYMKHVYQHDHNVNPFFQKLREKEESIYDKKRKIVSESIKEYLNNYCNQLSIESLTKDILDQQNKTFILWDCVNFKADQIKKEELEIEKIEKIKNNNTIVVVSKSGTKHNMLLRWRNHLGILYPAWQISIQR